jgi:demethylmenaquinone methyltransferase/2-methoxy-6-polyprenyl-1,4-benzoquinol methylase
MNNILQEQIAYYRARAAEYDEWFYRKGRFDRGQALNQQWFDEAAVIRDKLHSLPRQAHVLELAPGTGIWTQELVKLADKVTALDASPEMIAINRAKVQADNVDYHQTDLFQWQPEQQYDMVFFGFWLSHVPPEKLDGFLQAVAAALKPGGHVFMVDSKQQSTAMANNQLNMGDGVQQERTLNDGRNFTIIKIYYEPDVLESAFARAGIDLNARFTETYFIYAHGRKS